MKRRKSKRVLKKKLKKIKLKDYSKIGWKRLSKEQKGLRIRSLRVLRLMRRQGYSFTKACKEVKINPEIALHHIKSALYKKKGKWLAKKSDRIQREMRVYSDGKIRTIIVRNSEDASLIGRHLYDIRKALDTQNEKHLEKYMKKVITDSRRRKIHLEFNWDKILKIEERKERPEDKPGYPKEEDYF